MGGSSGYTTGGGSTSDGIDCGRECEFLVIIEGNEETIWKECKVGQEVYLEFIRANLPRLEVKRLPDKATLGLVPASYTMLISCIESGWEYKGKIGKIMGNEYDPKIYVKVKGVK